MNEEDKQKYIEAYRELKSVTVASQVIGVNRTTVWRWQEADEQFRNECNSIKKEIADEKLEENEAEIHRRALEKSDLLLMFETKKLDPSYREQAPPQAPTDVKIYIAIPPYDEKIRLVRPEIKELTEGNKKE